MNISILRTLAAGLTACACLSGLSTSANAQFFSNDTSIHSGHSRLPAISQSDRYDLRISQQRQDQRRTDQPWNSERYIRTNTQDDLQPRDRSSHGRRANGQCRHSHKNGFHDTDSISNYDSAARYQARNRLTGWDPANQPINPATAQPSQRPHRHGQMNGQSQRGHCHGGACSIDQRDHRDGQDRQQYRGQPNLPADYDEFSLTRRNAPNPNDLPTRNSYLN